jgi:pimeloyl-ACP methyl ester carboxylesterase
VQAISTHIFPSVAYEAVGEGQAVMLIHGFPASGSLWRLVVPALAEHCRVIVPDLPGTGNSSPATGPFSMEDVGDAITAILEKEDISRVLLVGHSMGGYASFSFAHRYPERLYGLSLVHSMPAADDEEKVAARRKAIDLIKKGGKRGFVAQTVQNLFGESFRDNHADVVRFQTDDGMTVSEESLIYFYEAMIQRKDHTDLLRQAPFPLQWTIGRQDKIMHYRKLLQHSHVGLVNFVQLMDTVGHAAMLEEPTVLAKNLLNFIHYCCDRYGLPKSEKIS